MANSITNDDNLTVTALTLTSGFCHTSLQDTHDEFAGKTQVANLGAAFTASSATPGGTDNNKLWVKMDSTDSNPLGFWFHETTRGWEQFLSTPSGAIIQFAGSTAPDGWLLCDGSEVSETTYKRLYDVIADTYAAGQTPGAGNFFLPDLRGRVAVGVDGSAARLTANDALTNSGGAEKVTLTGAESGTSAHTHTFPIGNESGGGYAADGALGSVNVTTSASTEADALNAHNNMPPYLVVNYIIKT